MQSSNKCTLVAVAILLLSATITEACDPSSAEMAVRMRMQAYMNMFPSIYEDIRNGRLTPSRGGYGQYNQQQQGYLPNQGQVYPNQGQVVYPNQGQQVIPNQGQIVQPVGR